MMMSHNEDDDESKEQEYQRRCATDYQSNVPDGCLIALLVFVLVIIAMLVFVGGIKW